MGNRDDPNTFRQNHVENSEWKALCKILAKASAFVNRPSLWGPPNLGDRMLYPCLEIKSEALCAVLIEFHSVVEFCSRRAVDHNRLHEYFARNSENTFSAGSPLARPLLISSARRANSDTHAVSASSSMPWSSDSMRKWANSARSVSLRLAKSDRSFSADALIAKSLIHQCQESRQCFASGSPGPRLPRKPCFS